MNGKLSSGMKASLKCLGAAKYAASRQLKALNYAKKNNASAVQQATRKLVFGIKIKEKHGVFTG